MTHDSNYTNGRTSGDSTRCPKCDCVLNSVELTGVQVDQCDRCGGIWFDFGELEQTLTREDISRLKAAIDTAPAPDSARAACPRCGKGNMIRVSVTAGEPLHIDTCSRCYGQWLDGGELERLRQTGAFQTVADFFKNMV